MQPCNCRSNLNITTSQNIIVSVRCHPQIVFQPVRQALRPEGRRLFQPQRQMRQLSCSRCTAGCCSLLRPPPPPRALWYSGGRWPRATCSVLSARSRWQLANCNTRGDLIISASDSACTMPCCRLPAASGLHRVRVRHCSRHGGTLRCFSVFRHRHNSKTRRGTRPEGNAGGRLEDTSPATSIRKFPQCHITNRYIANSQVQHFARSHLQLQPCRCKSRCIVSAHPYLIHKAQRPAGAPA